MRNIKTVSGSFLILVLTGLSLFAQNQIDSSFNAVPLQAATAATGRGQIVQPDDKVIIWGGAFGSGTSADGQIARLNFDGSFDSTFNYCGCHLSTVANVALQADGKLLVAGSETTNKAKMIRLNSDGSIDASYNPAFSFNPNSMSAGTYIWAVQPDGKSLVEKIELLIGRFTKIIYRYNTDGTLDSSFASITVVNFAISGGVVDLVLMPDGRFYLGTQTGSGPGTSGSISRYNANGSFDNSFEKPILAWSPGSTTYLTGLALQPDGNLIISGRFDTVNGISKPNIARVFSGGNVDLNFTVSGLNWGDRAKVLQNGKILVTADNNTAMEMKFFRLNSDGSMNGAFAKSNNIKAVLDRWVLDSAERVVFFGESTTSTQRFFRLNPDGDLDAGFNPMVGDFGKVYSIARQTDGKLIVAGIFSTMNGTARSNLARVNSDSTIDTSFDPGTGFDVAPKTLLMQADGKILALGAFTSYNGTPRAGLARLNSNGSLDSAFNPTFNGAVNDAVLQPDGKIVIAGNFISVNSTGRTGAARLNSDGSLDNGFAPIIGGAIDVKAVLVQTDGKIMIGGNFSGVNGFNRSWMARLNSDGTSDTVFTYGGSAAVNGMLQQTDGRYIVFGSVIIRVNNNGSADGTFTAPAFSSSDPSPRINSVLIQADGSLVVGGFFNSAGALPRKNFTRLGKNGALDGSFFPTGANGEVRALAGQPDGKVILGGDFSTLQNTTRAGIGRVSTVSIRNLPFDFDGDGRADIGVFRASEGNWYQVRSQSGFTVQNFGLNGDVITPGDFDGDGKADLAIYRPSTGTWWYASSLNGGFYAVGFGFAGITTDIPLAEDFDGDGKADFVVYRPSMGIWFRLGSSGLYSPLTFGQAGDIPVVADMDGDGKADPTIFRPSTGMWWYRGSNGIDTAAHWGENGDIPVAADYDGDGKTDLAVYRPAWGAWLIFNSGTGSMTAINWGLAEDKPVAADYDGDGRADIAVYRPSNGVWFILQSTSGFTGMQFGLATDKAIPNAYNP